MLPISPAKRHRAAESVKGGSRKVKTDFTSVFHLRPSALKQTLPLLFILKPTPPNSDVFSRRSAGRRFNDVRAAFESRATTFNGPSSALKRRSQPFTNNLSRNPPPFGDAFLESARDFSTLGHSAVGVHKQNFAARLVADRPRMPQGRQGRHSPKLAFLASLALFKS
jgi:hypothetical protein